MSPMKWLIVILLLLMSPFTGFAAENASESLADMPSVAPLNPEFLRYLEQLNHSDNNAISSISKHAESPSGVIPSPVDMSHLRKSYAIIPNTSAFSTTSSLPATFDLRDENRVTSVKDQGQAGSCWAHAALASLESCLMPAENTDFSENNMKNLLSSNYPEGFDRTHDAGGNSLMATAYLVRWTGPVSENDDPYNQDSGVSPTDLPAQKHVHEVLFLPGRADGDPNDNDFLKQAVMDYGAVHSSMKYNVNGFDGTFANYYYDSYVGDESGHAIAIVGWDTIMTTVILSLSRRETVHLL